MEQKSSCTAHGNMTGHKIPHFLWI